MSMTDPSSPIDPQIGLYVGWAVFAFSELVGISKLQENSIIQVVLHIANAAFPFEVKRRRRKDRGRQVKAVASSVVAATQMRPPAAPPPIKYKYTDEQLDDMTLTKLRLLAKRHGNVPLGKDGVRSELVPYLLDIVE